MAYQMSDVNPIETLKVSQAEVPLRYTLTIQPGSALAGLCHGQRVERREQDRLANVYDENGAQHASKFDQVGVPRPQYSIVILICSGCLSGIAALRR